MKLTMSEEKPKEPRVSKIQWALFVIAMLSLLVAFTGADFGNIISYISSYFFPKADFILESSNDPYVSTCGVKKKLNVGFGPLS